MNHRTDGELQAYLDAELHRDEAAVVAEHLMVCTDCRVRLGELRMAGEEFRRTIWRSRSCPGSTRRRSRRSS